MITYEINRNTWKKIYDVYGTVVTKVNIMVNPPNVQCQFRVRVGYGWFAFNRKTGIFTGNKQITVWNGYLQIKPAEDVFVTITLE